MPSRPYATPQPPSVIAGTATFHLTSYVPANLSGAVFEDGNAPNFFEVNELGIDGDPVPLVDNSGNQCHAVGAGVERNVSQAHRWPTLRLTGAPPEKSAYFSKLRKIVSRMGLVAHVTV